MSLRRDLHRWPAFALAAERLLDMTGVAVGDIGPIYPSADNAVAPTFTCGSYTDDPPANENYAGFCNRRVMPRSPARAALEVSDPTTASQVWTKIDRTITRLAPCVVIREGVSTDFVSRRVGNYTPCWLSLFDGATGACLDQLWVH